MSRIYVVHEFDGLEQVAEHLVIGNSQAQVVSFKARARYKAVPATAQDVAKLMGEGVKVEDATRVVEPE